MDPQGHDEYFTTQALTAPSQKLHLMLLEAALRHGRRAEQLWHNEQDEQAGEALLQCQEVVGELIRGLNPDAAPELVSQVASSYLFIQRSLISAYLRRDAKALQGGLRVLEIERETWRELCSQLDGGEADDKSASVPPPKMATHPSEDSETSPSPGLSLEA